MKIITFLHLFLYSLLFWQISYSAFVKSVDNNGPICSTTKSSVRSLSSKRETNSKNNFRAENMNRMENTNGLVTNYRQLQTTSNYQLCDLQSAEDCPEGSICFETSTGYRCLPPLQAGETCTPAGTQPCAGGLSCANHKCEPILMEGDTCDTTPTGKSCTSGTVCAGIRGRKRCVKPMGFGKPCALDPYWVCEKQFECRYYKCVYRSLIDCECDGAIDTQCEKSTICKLNHNSNSMRCTSLRRLDTKQWVFVSANERSWIYLNGVFLEQTIGASNYVALPAHLNMGDVLSLKIKGSEDWSAFIVAVGAYQIGKPAWAIRSGAHEFLATKEFNDPNDSWMSKGYDACAAGVWQRVRYAPGDSDVEVGNGKPRHFPYWTGARFMWARDVEFGETIFVRFKRGGHRC